MELDLRSHPPVILSHLSAQQAATEWIEANDFRKLRDASGLEWTLTTRGDQIPSKEDTKILLWRLFLHLSAHPTGEVLVATGTLDPVQDRRIIHLLGSKPIPFSLKPKTLQGESETELRRKLQEALPELKEKLLAEDFHSIKRQLVAKWLEKITTFSFSR